MRILAVLQAVMVVVFGGFGPAIAREPVLDAPEAIWIVDDFEDQDLVGWTSPSGSCSASVAGFGAAGTAYSLAIDGACGHYGGVTYDFVDLQATGLSLWLRPSAMDVTHLYVVLDDDDTAANGYIIAFFASSSGWYSMYGDLGAQYLLMPNDDFDWHELGLTIDWVGKNVDVAMDGQWVQFNVPFDNDGIGTLRRMHLYNLEMASAWYDQIVASTPGVTTGIMMDGFESADGSGWTESVPAMPLRLVIYAAPGVSGPIGGRGGADVLCGQAAAGMDGIPLHATTRAFLSVDIYDSIASMPSRYGVPTDRVVTGPNTNKVADDWADLLDGTIDMTLNAAGVMGLNNWYSGSAADGSTDTDTCAGWTAGVGSSSGRYGYHGSTTSTWISAGDAACGDGLTRILCLAWR